LDSSRATAEPQQRRRRLLFATLRVGATLGAWRRCGSGPCIRWSPRRASPCTQCDPAAVSADSEIGSRLNTVKLALFRALLAAGLAIAASAAADGDADIKRTIAAGKFDETCMRLEAGRSIRWRFEASTPLDFNLHFHRGADVHYPVKRDRVRTDSGVFTADAGEDYCLMWTNRGTSPAQLRSRVKRMP